MVGDHETVHQGPPYLQAAVLCWGVEHDDKGQWSIDRVLSAIPLPRRITEPTTMSGPEDRKLTLLVSLRSDGVKGAGSYHLKIRGIGPSGTAVLEQVQTIDCAEEWGVAVNYDLSQVAFTEDGRHHFDIWLDDRFLTRVPLLLIYLDMSNRGTA